jgi:hypothetical protein
MHGVLDYLTAGTLIALPRAMGWSDNVTRLLTGMAVGHTAYALVTRYELGVVRALPMRGHLALDGLAAAALCAAPFVMTDEPDEVRHTLLGLGLYELATTLMTDPQTSLDRPRSFQSDDLIMPVPPEDPVPSMSARMTNA